MSEIILNQDTWLGKILRFSDYRYYHRWEQLTTCNLPWILLKGLIKGFLVVVAFILAAVLAGVAVYSIGYFQFHFWTDIVFGTMTMADFNDDEFMKIGTILSMILGAAIVIFSVIFTIGMVISKISNLNIGHTLSKQLDESPIAATIKARAEKMCRPIKVLTQYEVEDLEKEKLKKEAPSVSDDVA